MGLSLIPLHLLQELLAETEFLLEGGNSMFAVADIGLQHVDDVLPCLVQRLEGIVVFHLVAVLQLQLEVG